MNDEQLFGIVGTFLLKATGRYVPFGGFFIQDDRGNFKGRLTDEFGDSTIEGKEIPDVGAREFIKNYIPSSHSTGVNTPISYNIKRDGAKWRGHYHYQYENRELVSERVVCQINLLTLLWRGR